MFWHTAMFLLPEHLQGKPIFMIQMFYFFIHAIQVKATFIDHIFAYVSWPMRHPHTTLLVNLMKFGAAH